MTIHEAQIVHEEIAAQTKRVREEINPAIREKLSVFKDRLNVALATAVEIADLLKRKKEVVNFFIKTIEAEKAEEVDDAHRMEYYMRRAGNEDYEMMHAIIGVIRSHLSDECAKFDEKIAKLKGENPVKKTIAETVDKFRDDVLACLPD